MLTQRPAGTLDDLRTATELLSAAWRSGTRDIAESPAAIEWWYALSFPDPLADHLRLWFDGERLVAWSWHEPPELETHVWTGDAAADRAVYRALMIAVVEETGGAELGAFAADDAVASIAILDELGFQPEGRRLSQWQIWRGEGDVAESRLPDGYRIRSLRGPEEFPARVALHRAAFPASRLSVEKYERLLTVPHYRLENDRVIEAPDGSLAAYALGWWDPVGAVGEFEPVGTNPDHQRRGLAQALVTSGTRRFFEAGARAVQVYSDTSEAPAEALYEAAGFRRRAFHQRYLRRPVGPANGTIDT
jgi:ribosomal protein S18 acetylase RimI-like enzyme